MPEQLLYDGTLNFAGGQNAGLEPDLIADNQYALGVNVVAETGSLKPRWGLVHLDHLDWSETGDYTRQTGFDIQFEQVFLTGRFQALIPYSIGPDFYIIYIVSGFIFLINLQTFLVKVLNPTDLLNPNAMRINWTSAGKYLVIFDFPNVPFIVDGILIRRSNPALNEVPVSVLGTHNQNRLMIANAGIDWTAGDPAGNPLTPLAPITFTEINLSSSDYVGDVYQIPTANQNNDNITAMGFLQVLDQSTQIGSLLVATQHAIYSYPTFLPRAVWQGNVTNPSNVFGSLLLATGIAGQRSQVNVNSDFLFLSPESQVFALTMARDDQYRWSNGPVSREVKNFFNPPDPSLVEVTVLAKFKNKIFVTCNPHRVKCVAASGVPQFDIASSGLAVIETDNMATMGNKTPPTWAGVWTGADFLDLTENNNTLYVAAKQDGRNALFILDPNRTYDTINGKVRNVQSVIVSKEYNSKDGTMNKELHSLDLGIREIEECLNFKVEYKTDTLDQFNFWNDGKYDAPYVQCSGFPEFPNGLQRQGIRDLNIGGVNSKDCNPATQDILRWYKSAQVRITLSARSWRLKYIKLKSRPAEQSDNNTYCNQKCEGTPVSRDCFNIWQTPQEDCNVS